jgi:putative glutathione S-transferase
MIHDGAFRQAVASDRSAAYAAEPGRFQLFVSYACPFAHRTLVAHRLKWLDGIVPLSLLHPIWDTPEGWAFDRLSRSTSEAASSGFDYLHEAYSASNRSYTGKVTVPVLWDTRTRTIVNNESIEIVKLLNAAFDALGADRSVDLYPRSLRPEIDDLCARIGERLSRGVYAVGQAENQAAYDLAMNRLFGFLDEMERHLADNRGFLLGDRLTLADVLIFTPLVRFDCGARCSAKAAAMVRSAPLVRLSDKPPAPAARR